MPSSESSKSQGQVLPSEVAGAATEAASEIKGTEDNAKEQAKDEAADSLEEAINALKAETATAPARTSAGTAAASSAPSTPNTSTLPERALPGVTKPAITTSSTVSATTNPPAVETATAATATASKIESDDLESSSESPTDNAPPRKQGSKRIFIAVVGQTGTGKSSFINCVTGGGLGVGHGLSSYTKEVTGASTNISGHAVTLIDTPGFDDTYKSEGEIIALIGAYLKHSYDRSEFLSGVIYLHRITDPRVGMASKNSMIFLQKMCGGNNYSNIVLVTTWWDALPNKSIGEIRERELETDTNFWAKMIAEDAKKLRHNGTKESAIDIVKQIIPKPPVKFEMQVELSLDRASVVQTEVGKYFAKYLQGEKELLLNPEIETPLAASDRREVTRRIDEDISNMEEPVEDLLAKAQNAGLEGKNSGLAVAGEAAKTSDKLPSGEAAKTSDKLPPRRPFLLKLYDMMKWMESKTPT